MESKLIKSLQDRYAVKKFDPARKLTNGQLEEVVESARLTASSYGLQLMKLVIVEDPALREKLVEASYGQRQVADASHLLVLCRERKFNADHVEEYIRNIAQTRELNEGKLDGFKNTMNNWLLSKEEEVLNIWMDKQLYITLGTLLTACAILDIGSCPMEGFVNEEYDDILNLAKDDLASVLVLPIGFAAKDDPNAQNEKVRRSGDEFVVTK